MRHARLTTALVLAVALGGGLAQASAAGPAGTSRSLHPLLIWPVGDSITQGTVESVESAKGVGGGYRGFLDADLEAAGVDHRFVGSMQTNSVATLDARGQQRHEGHAGFLVGEVATGITGHVDVRAYHGGHWLSALNPDVVLIHLGTNDVLRRIDPSVQFPTSDRRADLGIPAQRSRFVADLAGRLQALVETVHRLRPRARVVLATITPVGHDTCDVATPAYATAVRALVAREHAHGVQIELADVFAAFTATSAGVCKILPDMLTPDGVHPTSRGYAVMAHVFERALLRFDG